jgi:hypothetical protein
MLLDLVQVAKLHTGITLAVVFAKILEDFGIADTVRSVDKLNQFTSYSHENRSWASLAIMQAIMIR